MKALYQRLGLLGALAIAAFVIALALHHFSRLPGHYTWLEPIRTTWDVYASEWFPTAVMVTYLVGVLRRTGAAAPSLVGLGGARALALVLLTGAVDAVVCPLHNGLDVGSVVLLLALAAREMPGTGRRRLIIGHAVFSFVAFSAVCYFYTVVKSLAFVGRPQVDAALVGFEQSIVGFVPHRAVAAYAATSPALVTFSDWIYFRFFHHMALTTALLFGMHQRKERYEYLGAIALCYLIGGPLYHLLPGVGPAFFDPEAYAYQSTLDLQANEIRRWLFDNTREVLTGESRALKTWGYLACMPSLHVAHESVMLFYARRSKLALAAASLFMASTVVSIVVLGWHYPIDAVGGLVVAAAAILIARSQRDRLLPSVLVVAADLPLRDAPFRQIWAALRKRITWPGIELPSNIVPAVAVAALFVRLSLALTDLDRVDRLFVSDRAYTTLAVARSLARGLGPTVDGLTASSAFEPLFAFVSIPAFWFTSSPIAGVVWALVLSSIADAASAWLLGRLARRSGGPLAGVLAASIWVLSPLAIGNALNGMESALALALQLAFVERWALAEERGKGYGLVGALGGLVLLARIDAAALVIAVIALTLAKHRERADLIGRLLGGIALVVAPWWVYAGIRFGSLVPEDASVTHAALVGQSLAHSFAGLGGNMAGGPFADFAPVRVFFATHPVLGATFAGALLATTGWLLRASSPPRPVVAFAIHVAAILVLYSFWRPELAALRRFLEPVYAYLALVFATVIARALRVDETTFRQRLLGLATIVLAIGFGLSGIGRTFRGGDIDDARGLNPPKGYGFAAREILAMLPAGAVVGSFQSGALSYYAPVEVKVVSFDAAVDEKAREAIENRTLLDYAAERHVTHIADFRSNIERLRAVGAESVHGIQAAPLGQAHWQGKERFTVYAVDLPRTR